MHFFNSRATPSTVLARLVVSTIIINLFIIIITVLSLRQSRLQYERQAEVITQNLARVIEENIDKSMDKVDVLLSAIVDAIEKDLPHGGLNTPAINDLLARQAARVPELDGLRVADAGGRIVGERGHRKVHTELSIADREYFQRLRQDPHAGFVISKPFVSRGSGNSVLFLARRINNPDRSFAGVIYGVISIKQFQRLFMSIKIGPHGVIALRDAEMGLITRYPEISSKKTAPELETICQSLGTQKAVISIDGIERMFTCQKFSRHPLYINVGIASEDYLSMWRHEAARMAALTVLFMGITLFGSWRIWHDWKRNDANLQALTEKEEKYRRLFEESKDTILISDAAGRILDVNRAGIDLFGYTKEELLSLDPKDLYSNVEDRERMWQKLLICGYVEDYAVEMKKKGGRNITVQLSVSVVKDVREMSAVIVGLPMT